MHPAVASSSSKSSLAIADSKATFVSMAPAVAALTRPFFAGAGVLLFRCLLMLALCSAVLQITLAPALAQTETVLYSFCQSSSNCSDGSIPYAGLTPDGRGNFTEPPSAVAARPLELFSRFRRMPTEAGTSP